MKKIFSAYIDAGFCCGLPATISFEIFLKENGTLKTVESSADGSKKVNHYKNTESIHCNFYNKDTMNQEIQSNLNCDVFDVTYTVSKNVRCGFGYRLSTKKIKVKNVSEFELHHYKNKENFIATKRPNNTFLCS